MTTNTASLPTLATAIWPIAGDTDRNRMLLRAIVLALAGSILMTLSAKIQIPFWPVPLTMQTFVVLVLGMAYGWRLGAATMMLYLVEGACGLPVFAGTPSDDALIANIDRLSERLPYTALPLDTLCAWAVRWIRHGGRLLNKPTKFEVRDGRY